ncbi:MAG: DUF2851 family protein [Balneolaceae bacterium]|nr:DUF2851 family protein [Balneolaceae bacterium]
MTNRRPYREELYQWIWHEVEFSCTNLKTTDGKPLKIVDTGSVNHGAGPDFLGAHIKVGRRDWYGSVEIHNKPKEWYRHGHHEDEEFNSVILHVVFEDDSSGKIITEDGHEPFTLVLKPYLTKNIYQLLERKQRSGIACSGNVSFINQQAFQKQVEKAHREYLEYKVEELLAFYDPSLPISTAWQQCLIAGVYQTLGIPSNKSQMKKLAQDLFDKSMLSQDSAEFSKQVTRFAFHSDKKFNWKQNGMRPASRPKPRIKQAAAIHFSIQQIPFQTFFKNELEATWNQILEGVDSACRPGKSRLRLIKQIVFLPAIYFLGDLLQSNRLKQSAFDAWLVPNHHVPPEMKAPFKKAGFTVNHSTNIIGLAHQYKRYCQKKNCHRCEVFKKAIRS